jgi:predicted Zn-dependent protease
VIAHEAAHIQLRHAIAIIQRERMVQDLSAAMDRAASIAGSYATPEERALLFRTSVSASVNTLFKNGYSREQEFEADKAAALLLAGAGYDPSSLAELLGVLDRTFAPASSAGTGSINGTHPSPAARIANLGRIRSGTGGDTLEARKPRFDTAVKTLP